MPYPLYPMPQQSPPFRHSSVEELARLEKELAEARNMLWKQIDRHTKEAVHMRTLNMKLRAALWYALHNDTRGNEDWRKAALEALKQPT